MGNLVKLLQSFLAGEFGYDTFRRLVVRFNSRIAESLGLSGLLELLAGVFPFVCIALMIPVLFFGSKLTSYVKLTLSFIVGFAFGAFLASTVGIVPSWILGTLFCILFIVLYRFFYVVFYALATFFGVSILLGPVLANMIPGLGMFVAMGIAAVLMIIAFVFRKYTEMMGTSFIGAVIIVHQLEEFLQYKINISDDLSVKVVPICMIILAIIGFVVQFCMRKKKEVKVN